MAVASAGPCAKHLTPEKHATLFIARCFTGRMLFLVSSQQYQSTEETVM